MIVCMSYSDTGLGILGLPYLGAFTFFTHSLCLKSCSSRACRFVWSA